MNKMFEYVNELGRTPVIPLLGFPGLKFLGNSISQGDVREIFDALPECMTVLHICGNTTYILKEMAATGAEGLSLDTAVKLDEVIGSVPDSVLIGNVDPVRIMLDGTPEKVYENTLDLRKKMKDHNNFILSTGCDLPPKTPHENIQAFVEAGKAKT